MRLNRRWVKHWIFSLIALFLFTSTIAGCSEPTQKGSLNQAEAVNEKTITVTDSFKRVVKIPAEVKRIGCLYAFSGHAVTMLGKGNEIVAIVEGLKRDKLLTQINPAIETAFVPVTSGVINIEELIKARPDVVFVSADTARNEGEVDKLRISRIPYLVVDFDNIEQQQFAVEMIGKAIGAEEKAKQYNDYFNTVIKSVQARVEQLPDSERIRVFHTVNEATRTDPRESLPADWLRKAGAINVSQNDKLKVVDASKYFASLEQIHLWNPDVILANESGTADYILSNEQWATLNAVRNKRVYQMPNGISRWGHPGSLETPMAIIWTAKTLYPQKFNDVDIVAETKKFYKQFFNISLDDELVGRIISGIGMRKSK